MENTDVEHQWEQQDDDGEVEEGLIARRKNINQTPHPTTIDVEFSSNNGGSFPVSNGEEEEEDFGKQNGIKVDEDEKEREKEKEEKSEYFVYYDTDKGTELQHESFAVEENGVDSTADERSTDIVKLNQANGNDVHSFISNENEQHQKQDSFSDNTLQPSQKSFEELDKSSSSYINNKTEITEIEVIKDGVDEITEVDVETVIKKQETHDLFCPNCNSCITKRVILRKRKRRVPVPGEDAKRNKPENPVSAQVNGVPDDSRNNQALNGGDVRLGDIQTSESNEFDHQREPDVFRCLSCFSIFMPTGNGFKLFRMFGNKSNEVTKSNEVNNQPSQKEVSVKKHWFSSIFGSDKVEPLLNKQGATQSSNTENNVLASSMQEANSHTTNGTTFLKEKPAAEFNKSQSLREPKGHILENNQVQSTTPTPSISRDSNSPALTNGYDIIRQQVGEESENAIKESNGNIAMDSLVTDTHDQMLTPYHTDTNDKTDYPGMFVVKPPLNNAEPEDNSVSPLHYDGLKLIVPPNVGSLIIDNSQMNQELDVTVQTNNSDIVSEASQQSIQNNVDIHLEEPLKVNNDILTPKQITLLEDLKNIERIKGKDAIITISATGSGTPGALEHVESGSQAAEQGGDTTATGGRSLDIVKSIVYGGLIELIASLSVVSSAVGANAATLNVLALGLANIFGGLLVISHDLWDLKNECVRGSQEDRYQQLLGRIADFPLHMFVSLLSYLVFGFLPPIVYGFSFRESNDRDLKLIMVAAASIVCIIILAAGKAYVQRPPKSYIKTIFYYMLFGFMVSGVSYFLGGLIMKLLEKLNVFHSGSVVNLSIHGASLNPTLASY